MKKKKFIQIASSLVLLSGLALTAACSNNSNSDQEKSKSSTTSKVNKKAKSTKSKAKKTVNETQTKLKVKKIKISQTKALNIFDQEFADKEIKEIDLKIDNNDYVYEITGFDKKKEYTMTIDANTGKVINKHSEKLDWDEHLQKGLNLDQLISRSQASKTAEKKANNGTSYEWKLDQDNNKPVWEVKVDDGKQKKEVKIDAIKNKVLETENDD